MNDLLKSALLGVVEGITEFLPVSSTGHLILAGDFLRFDEAFSRVFDIFIQLGAILAVAVLFRKRILDSLRDFSGAGLRLWGALTLSFLPAAVVGLLFHDWIESALFSPRSVALALITGGLLMIVVENRCGAPRIADVTQVGPRAALGVGLAQCLSLWPGMSRAACTILGAMACGLSVPAAAEYSFLLALPTMTAASGYALLKNLGAVSAAQGFCLAVGFCVSFGVAVAVVKAFVGYLQEHRLRPFAYYRIGLGALILLLGL